MTFPSCLRACVNLIFLFFRKSKEKEKELKKLLKFEQKKKEKIQCE